MSKEKPEKIVCIHCFTILNLNQGKAPTKCHSCQGWQKFRRHLELSNVIIALIVSLIAIIITFWTPLRELTAQKDPEINISILASNFNEMRIALSNSGPAPAGLIEAHIVSTAFDIQGIEVSKELWGTVIMGHDLKTMTLSANRGRGLYIMAQEEHIAYSESGVGACKIVLKYKVLRSGLDKVIEKKFTCYNYSPFPDYLKNKNYNNRVNTHQNRSRIFDILSRNQKN